MCEVFRTDQTLFNQHFRGLYVRLPYSYNAQPTRWRRPPPVANASSIAVVHLIGDPKPWKPLLGERARLKHAVHEPSRKLWEEACAAPIDGDLHAKGLRLEALATQLLGRRWQGWQGSRAPAEDAATKRKPSTAT